MRGFYPHVERFSGCDQYGMRIRLQGPSRCARELIGAVARPGIRHCERALGSVYTRHGGGGVGCGSVDGDTVSVTGVVERVQASGGIAGV